MRLSLCLTAFLTLLAGCDCAGPERMPCASSTDCEGSDVCIDRMCQPVGDAALPDGAIVDGGGERDTPAPTLEITPLDPVIEADGTPTDLPFRAFLGGTELTSATWIIDDVILGTLGADGVFHGNGLVAGVAHVTARYGEYEASTTVTVHVRVSRPLDGLSPGDVDTLRAGGTADGTLRWLYPYDETVFPQGLTAPVLQLAGAAGSAARITIDVEERSFHYEGFFTAAAPLQFVLPPEIWSAVESSTGAGHAVRIGVTTLVGGAAAGPVNETLRIAQGRLAGSIYYNSYNSALGGGGAILRVRFGEEAQLVQGGCTVCHSVSANGGRIATGLSWSGTDTITGTGNPIRSGTIDIGADGSVTTRYSDPDGRRYSFGALTPDGDMLLSSGVAPDNRIRGLSGTMPSRLWDTASGAEIPAPSFSDAVAYAVTPQFAPDGSALAFSWFADGGTTNGRVLAVMSFDGSTSPPLFGAPRRVVNLADTSRIVGWPSFLPDGSAAIYHEGTAFDTSLGGGAGNSNLPVLADLRLVDLNSCDAAGENCAVSNLDTLNGFAGATFTLPYGEVGEGHMNYEATVLPIAIGGYYWVVFTSRRCYGNTLAPGGAIAGGDDPWGYTTAGGGEIPSVRKKLWIAAIDLSGAPGSDRSHPAFYLSGQELLSGNMRGFAALDPCRADGASCESAADCCGGFCRQTGVDEDGAPILMCVPPPAGCSEELETCSVSADCCGAPSGTTCINNRCAQPGVD
jgi:hypothetical protein